MSNTQAVGAGLKGFVGPFFPDRQKDGRAQGIHRIQKRLGYHPERINEMLLDEVAAALERGRVRMYVRTNDRYLWTGFVEFAHKGNRYGVLFPMLHDSDRRDGTYADRSVALYSMAASTEEQRLGAMTAFATTFVRVYKQMFGNAIKHSKAKNGVS